MIVAVTGTPGTGKTSISRELGDLMDIDVIDITEFAKERGLGEQGEEFEVDVSEMVSALEQDLEGGQDALLEGHLAHHFPADHCVVLRCDPQVLRKRLEERDYSREKIDENLEAEAMDLILQEAVREQESIIELDTTGLKPAEAAEELAGKIRKGETGYGQVDWSSFLGRD